MPALGSGINAALGRQDYSGIARGGEVMGQGMANAANIRAQGMMQIGQQIGQSIQGFQKKREEKKRMEQATGAVGRMLSANPQLAGQFGLTKDESGEFDSGEIKAFVDGAGGPENAVKFATTVSQALAQQQAAQDAQLTNQALQAEKLQMERDKLTAAQNQPPKGMTVSPEKIAEYRRNGIDYTVIAENPDGTLQVENVSPFGPAASTTIHTGSPNRRQDEAYSSLNKRYEQEMVPLQNSKTQIEAMDALLNSIDEDGQMITGGLANVELPIKSVLNSIGLTDFSDVANTQEYLGNSVTLTGQIIKQFGAGTGLSDADRDYAAQAAAGKITMDKDALKRLVAIAKKTMKAKQELFNRDVDRNFPADDFEWENRALKMEDLNFTDYSIPEGVSRRVWLAATESEKEILRNQ